MAQDPFAQYRVQNQDPFAEFRVKEDDDPFAEFRVTETEEPERKMGMRDYLAMGIRGASALVPGGLPGAIAGGIGEGLAQTVEPRESYNLKQIGAQSALGAIPFGRAASLTRGALKGGALGAAGTVGTELAETGELPSAQRTLFGAGLGALGGGVTGKLGTKLPSAEDAAATLKPKMRANVDNTFSPADNPSIKFDSKGRQLQGPEFIASPKEFPKVDIKRGTAFQEAMAFPRAVMSSWDLSAPFRQAFPLIHTAAWRGNFGNMIKAAKDESFFRNAMTDIAHDPNFRATYRNGKRFESLAERAGVSLTDLTDFTKREEQLMSTLAEQVVPGVRASNRAYVLFLNKVRQDTFNNLVKNNPEIKNNDVLLRQMGDYVNNATGRGNIKGLERHAATLNATLFSPKLVMSRLQMLNPKNYVFAPPQVRKEYQKSMLAMASTWMTMAGLAKVAGAEVSMDMDSSDFGKIKIGNTRLDPAGGFQQYLVLSARLGQRGFEAVSGEKRPADSKPLGRTIEDFVLNKLNPVLGYGARATGMGSSGFYPFRAGDEAAKLFTPMFLRDLHDLAMQEPETLGLAPLGMFGMGIDTYEPRKQEPGLFGWPSKYDVTLPAGR
jgi:hypothetical protein